MLLVCINLLSQRVQPDFAMIKRCNRCFHRKNIRFSNFIRIDRPPHLVAQIGIGNHNRRRLQPSQIECLGRRQTGD